MTKLSKKNSSKNSHPSLIAEIKDALKSVTYGSIEIFVQNKTVTQITVRNIKKTSVEIEEGEDRNMQEITSFEDRQKHLRNTIIKRV